MNAFQLVRYFPDFVNTDAKRNYGKHDELKTAKDTAQRVWDKWTDKNRWSRERLKWNDDKPPKIFGMIKSGNKDRPYMVVFIIHPVMKIAVPELDYKFEDMFK